MELALEQVTRMGAYHVRAVRQACRRAAALPPPAAAPPARVLHLPEVEERRLAACHFPFVKRLQDFEWDAQPTLNRAEVERLFSLSFIDAHDNVAFLGAPGLGKTMLAVGLGSRRSRSATVSVSAASTSGLTTPRPPTRWAPVSDVTTDLMPTSPRRRRALLP